MLQKHSIGVFLIFTVIHGSVKSEHVISYINQALEDFLKNFDQIENIFKSNDSPQDNFTSYEDEDQSKPILYDKHEDTLFEQDSNVKSTTFEPGTAGIYESHSSDDDAISSKEIPNQINSKPRKPKFESKKVNHSNVKAILENIKDEIENDNNSSDSNGSEENRSEEINVISIEMPAKTKILKQKNDTIYNKRLIKQKRPNVYQNILGEKTRFSIKKFRSNRFKNDTELKVPLKVKETSSRIKKITYSEAFSPNNIWQEIISRPIKLKKDEDAYFRKDGSEKAISRSIDNISSIILINETAENCSLEEATKLTEDNEHTNKDYLRSTYGETCLQIPIKKCHKVMKTVNKQVCKMRFKCSAEFKESFLENGKKGCREEFLSIKKQHNDIVNQEHTIQVLNIKEFKRNARFSDATRNKFYKNSLLTKKMNISDSFGPNIKPKPLYLRDKYETECQKENRKKCINACVYATKATCRKHLCDINKDKSLKKACKEQCIKSFTVDKSTDSDSSSDSISFDSDSSKIDSDRDEDSD